VETVVLLRLWPKGGGVSVVRPSRYDGRNFNVLLPATLKLRKPSCCSGSAEGRRGPRMQKLYRSQAYEVKARGSALDPSPWSSHGSVQEVMHGAATKPKAAVGTFKKPFQQSSMQ